MITDVKNTLRADVFTNGIFASGKIKDLGYDFYRDKDLNFNRK